MKKLLILTLVIPVLWAIAMECLSPERYNSADTHQQISTAGQPVILKPLIWNLNAWSAYKNIFAGSGHDYVDLGARILFTFLCLFGIFLAWMILFGILGQIIRNYPGDSFLLALIISMDIMHLGQSEFTVTITINQV